MLMSYGVKFLFCGKTYSVQITKLCEIILFCLECLHIKFRTKSRNHHLSGSKWPNKLKNYKIIITQGCAEFMYFKYNRILSFVFDRVDENSFILCIKIFECFVFCSLKIHFKYTLRSLRDHRKHCL